MVRTLALGTLAILFALSGVAAPATSAPGPEETIRKIYADHQPWAGKSIDWSKTSGLTKYLDDSLVALIKKDNDTSAANGDIGCLDFDPFLDAQDYDESGITPLQIRTTSGITGPVCEVTFTGKSKAWKDWNAKLIYDMRNTKAGWRVYDIVYKSGDSLRKILTCNDK